MCVQVCTCVWSEERVCMCALSEESCVRASMYVCLE